MINIIIPTFNRYNFLRDTLQSVASQTLPASEFEVIVVDDGSTDETPQIVDQPFPFRLRYAKQQNQGDAQARNFGVELSQADLLIFLDDDILIAPDYLRALKDAHAGKLDRIVVGGERIWLKPSLPPYAEPIASSNGANITPLPFVEICSNNMSIKRQAYINIGMMKSLDFPGSSIWCDVEFNYRAFQKDYEFFKATKAVCWHRDYTKRDLESQKKRMHEVAYRAVALFQQHPQLPAYLPMFRDIVPIDLKSDRPTLVARKVARKISSSSPAMWGLERMATILEDQAPSSNWRRHFARWVRGGYLYQGFEKGRKEFGDDAQL